MKKILNIVLDIFIVSLCFSGCRGSVQIGNTGPHIYSIDLDNELSEAASLFDFCTEVELRVFDDRPEAMMDNSTICSEVLGDTSIFFLSRKDHLIREFDYDGNLLRIEDRYGRGPGEFTMAHDMLINKYSNTLDILNPQGIIYQYSIDSLSWKNTMDFSDKTTAVHYFYALSPTKYILYSDSGYPQLFLYSADTGIENVDIDNVVPKWILGSTFSPVGNPFHEIGDEIKYSVKSDGSIYTLCGTSMQLQYKWDMGKYQFDINQIVPDKDVFYYVDLHQSISHKYATSFSRLAESDRYIIQNFSYKDLNSWNSIVLDKTNQSISVFRKTKENVILLAEPVRNNCMYVVVNPEYVNLLVNESLLKDEKSKEAYRRINDDSNVVLIKYHLKQ